MPKNELITPERDSRCGSSRAWPAPDPSSVVAPSHTVGGDEAHQLADDAIELLCSLIAEAVRCSNDERVAILDRVLRDVERILELTQEQWLNGISGNPSIYSVHERQGQFVMTCGDRSSAAVLYGTLPPVRALDESAFQSLTLREKQIIQHLARGAANKVIARKLNVTEGTVKVHIKAILRKLRLKNRTQAALCAIQQGWLRWA